MNPLNFTNNNLYGQQTNIDDDMINNLTRSVITLDEYYPRDHSNPKTHGSPIRS